MTDSGGNGSKKKTSDEQVQNVTQLPTEEKMETDQYEAQERSSRYLTETRTDRPRRIAGAYYQNYHHNDEVTRNKGTGEDDSLSAQMQEQQIRSLQASIQMLYDVYEHSMGLIEELEARDSREMSQKTGGLKTCTRSRISLPPQEHKARTDVTAIIVAELTCLQAMLSAAPKEVIDSTTQELIEKTLLWLAHRQDMEAPLADCDDYAINVLELLLQVDPRIKPRKKGPNAGKLDGHIVNGTIKAYVEALHEQKLQDEEFRRDEKKQAKLGGIRGGKSLHLGARRVLDKKPYLEEKLSSVGYTGDQR